MSVCKQASPLKETEVHRTQDKENAAAVVKEFAEAAPAQMSKVSYGAGRINLQPHDSDSGLYERNTFI